MKKTNVKRVHLFGALKQASKGKTISNSTLVTENKEGLIAYRFNRENTVLECFSFSNEGDIIEKIQRDFTFNELFHKCWSVVSFNFRVNEKPHNDLEFCDLESIPYCSKCDASFDERSSLQSLVYVWSSASSEHYRCSVCGADEVTVY